MNEEEFQQFSEFVGSEAGREILASLTPLFYDQAFVISLLTNSVMQYLVDRSLHGAIGRPYHADVEFKGGAKYRITLESLDGS